MSKTVVERLRHPLGQRREQIDADAHVAGLDDHGASSPLPRSSSSSAEQAGGADDVHLAGLRGELGERRRSPPEW